MVLYRSEREQLTMASSWEHRAGLLGGGSLWVESWHMRKGFGLIKLG